MRQRSVKQVNIIFLLRTDGGLYTCIGESQGRTVTANTTLTITESSTLAVKVGTKGIPTQL